MGANKGAEQAQKQLAQEQAQLQQEEEEQKQQARQRELALLRRSYEAPGGAIGGSGGSTSLLGG